MKETKPVGREYNRVSSLAPRERCARRRDGSRARVRDGCGLDRWVVTRRDTIDGS